MSNETVWLSGMSFNIVVVSGSQLQLINRGKIWHYSLQGNNRRNIISAETTCLHGREILTNSAQQITKTLFQTTIPSCLRCESDMSDLLKAQLHTAFSFTVVVTAEFVSTSYIQNVIWLYNTLVSVDTSLCLMEIFNGQILKDHPDEDWNWQALKRPQHTQTHTHTPEPVS